MRAQQMLHNAHFNLFITRQHQQPDMAPQLPLVLTEVCTKVNLSNILAKPLLVVSHTLNYEAAQINKIKDQAMR